MIDVLTLDPNYSTTRRVIKADPQETAGLAITDELLNTLADIKTDGNILPMPVMTVQKRPPLHFEVTDYAVTVTVLRQ